MFAAWGLKHDMSNWEQYTPHDISITAYQDNSCNEYTLITPGSDAPVHDSKGNLVPKERGCGFTSDLENRRRDKAGFVDGPAII